MASRGAARYKNPDLLGAVLNLTPDFIGTAISMEPNALDGRDADFTWKKADVFSGPKFPMLWWSGVSFSPARRPSSIEQMEKIMDLTRRHLIGATALLCAGCGGGGSSDIAAPLPAITTTPAGTPTAANYRATLTSRWDAATFPTRFPASAHLTGLVGATHADTVSFWAAGRAASAGVKDVAERGSKTTILDEVAQAIAAGKAGSALSGDGVSVGASQVTLDFSLTQNHPQVTLLSMLGPSPDWFIGVSGLALFESGIWRPSVLVNLRVYDSGTDDGTSFTSPDAVTSPAGTVQRLSTLAADTDFIDGVHRSSGAYLATIEFTLMR